MALPQLVHQGQYSAASRLGLIGIRLCSRTPTHALHAGLALSAFLVSKGPHGPCGANRREPAQGGNEVAGGRRRAEDAPAPR
ncbi:hypothetical protein Shyhy01_18790 [Streptomyces hygroscopicus subsp. hygroscopicus]|nr:hypothetical protein Shyhy01_18790 [Streptomyces hygroscopicus subsp. hygroscopicus]